MLREITEQVAPAGYSFDYQGQSRQLIQEGSVLALTFGFAIIVVFLVLAAQYESLRDPLDHPDHCAAGDVRRRWCPCSCG